jgi:hypothetical protein
MAESNKKSLLQICEDFHEKFYLSGDKLSHTGLIKHSIPTPALDEKSDKNLTLPITGSSQGGSQ